MPIKPDRNLRFAELIQQTRQKAGLNQQQLALRVRKPQSYISKIERSERRLTLVDFEDLALALEFSPPKLLAKLYPPTPQR